MKKRNSTTSRLMETSVLLVLVLIPFHAFFTVWAASNFGHFDGLRLWKEMLLAILSIGAVCLVAQEKKLRTRMRNDKVVQLTLIFLLFMVLMTTVGLLRGEVGTTAAAYGLAIQARPFLFMLVCMIVFKNGLNTTKIRNFILTPAAIVIVFGLLQTFILPADFLKHFGYGPSTQPAFLTVDNKPGHVRVQSTLRGPNPLGAYLAAVIILYVGYALKDGKRLKWAAGIVASIILLASSYSRSAWIGTVVGIGFLLYISIKTRATRQRVVVAGLALFVAMSCFIVLMRNNDNVQNFAFHTDENSLSAQSSNEVRANALKSGLEDIYREPLGRGVGSAGPASERNAPHAPRISESYFLQTGQEAGVIGLALFLDLLVAILRRLWRERDIMLPRLALASLVGLIAINLISHAWADDTLAYFGFGLIGLALAGKNSIKSEKHATL